MRKLLKSKETDVSEQLKVLLKGFKEKLVSQLSSVEQFQKPVLFLSVGSKDHRAFVFTGIGNHIDTAWKNAADKAIKYIKKNKLKTDWLKVDIVKNLQIVSVEDFIEKITETREKYFRYGISLDSDFNLAFLEQEINANAFIKFDKEYNRSHLNEQNMNHYCRLHRNMKGSIDFNKITRIILFETTGFFYDGELYELESSFLDNGRRKTPNLTSDSVLEIIQESSQFLANLVQESGEYIYGYFPCFDKKISFYNILRHASSTYSLIEAYDVTKDELLVQPIQRALSYLEKEAIYKFNGDQDETFAYVVDKASDSEIKLGANAAAILAFSKYTKVFKDDTYIPVMRQLANGIELMQDANTGQFVHVLNYPDLSVKEAFRIIYYDGEAAFALMRLYDIDRNPKWLEIVERAFSYFIENDYWKHQDHWLSYCANELTTYRPLDKYFQFGLENVKHRLDFMYERETTYPTFLELTTAAYKMIIRIKELGRNELLGNFDEAKLFSVIQHRAHYQLNGFFYPEVAMYFKNPGNILSGFFIRHHSFRCRIDDVEHNISGYCSYLTDVLKDKI